MSLQVYVIAMHFSWCPTFTQFRNWVNDGSLAWLLPCCEPVIHDLFQGLYSIGVHKSRNGLGPAYLTTWLSPEATVSQLQSVEWLIWSSLSSCFWQISLGKGPSATAFILKYCADLHKMLKTSTAWRRCSGMAEQSEFFHANGVYLFFFLNRFFSCFIYFLSACPCPSFWGDLGSWNVQPLLSGPGTKFWTCSYPGVSPLEIWSQIQGVREISKEAVSKLQRVFTFLVGVTWG